jgi:dynein heavy chain
MSEQLSRQQHYDFGMRALKQVLTLAGNLRRELEYVTEQKIVVKALHDSNIPKLVDEDIPLFKDLM